ncbi:tetratricopeptide repeat-containing sulfotransferase family protein, partial [Phenylobacterium sp.]|uniref:tetratricopeptide repeat-containing sulfotransferase family protein n=1 Tax=Phenylobacterium sp. TaxID=1871053 RepID=UPI002C9B5651
MSETLAAEPADAAGWAALGDRLRLAGDLAGADRAYARQLRAGVTDPQLVEAADALHDNRLADAQRLLNAVLQRRPSDAAAVRMLAEVAARIGRLPDAERLLVRCLQLSPRFPGARYALALVLHRQNRPLETLREAEALLAEAPGHPIYRHLKAAALVRVGEYAKAAETYAAVLADHPDQPLSWMSYGHVLKILGRQADAVAAYRRSVDLRPGLGEAWWSLANLKTVRFDEADVAVMEAELARDDLDEDDRFHLCFALGKAHEDAGRYGPAFARYEEGNALRRRRLGYQASETTQHMRRCKALMSAGFFAARAGQGDPAPDPIFIVGLPRAGSTLIEQILSSHSQVEGTQELADLPAIAQRLGGRARRASEGAYPDVLAALSPVELAALGQEYLGRAKVHRKLGRPFFIDKNPTNWAHVGLIQLALPNARIIDARRHPLGCGFSAFKQHFAEGQEFSYALEDIGRYYADYVELMAHFDAVLPGRIHRVIYEEMVADPETQVRALLDHCGLPFEE